MYDICIYGHGILQQEITRHTVIYGVWCMYTVLLILPESFATGFSAGFGQKFEFTNFHAF
jgi:hypothetical protein